MTAMAKELTDDDLRTLSGKIEILPPPKASGGVDKEKLERGKAILAKEPCGSCHGKRFEGYNNVPRIANQREDYLLKALRDYKSGRRIGYGNAAMPETLGALSDAELADVAHALANLK